MYSHSLRKALFFGPCFVLIATVAAAASPDDPWARVPAPPAGCYEGQDHYAETMDASMAQLGQDMDTQDAVNDELNHQMLATDENGETDMMAMAAKMQQLMMDDPEKAMQMMQSLQSASGTFQEQAPGNFEKEQELAAELDQYLTDYDAAYKEMSTATDEKFSGLPTVMTEAGEMFAPEAAADLRRISGEANAEYARLCKAWFQEGPFPDWLTKYRQYLVEERVPLEESVAEQTRSQLEFQQIDVSNYHSTAAMKAAHDYGLKLGKIYGKRQEQPFDFFEQYLGEGR